MTNGMSAISTQTTTNASPNIEQAVQSVRQAGDTVARGAFVARAMQALARIAADTDEQALIAATGAPTDYDVLLQALEAPDVLTRLESPLAAARLRGLRYREQLLNAEGGVLSVADVAALLKISRQAVDKRRQSGRLIGLTTGRRGYAYPAWQFDERTGVLPGLETVLAALREHYPWMQAAFMLNPNARLGGVTPLELLRAGRIDDVLRAARAYGEHGAA